RRVAAGDLGRGVIVEIVTGRADHRDGVVAVAAVEGDLWVDRSAHKDVHRELVVAAATVECDRGERASYNAINRDGGRGIVEVNLHIKSCRVLRDDDVVVATATDGGNRD